MNLINKVENFFINNEKKLKALAVASWMAASMSAGFFGGVYYSKMQEQTGRDKVYGKIAVELHGWADAFSNYYKTRNK